MRQTRALVSPAKIHQEGGQIVNFTFLSEISFLNEIPTIVKSIFDSPQICYADFVSNRKDIWRRSGFRTEKFFFGSSHVKFAGRLFLDLYFLLLLMNLLK